MEEVWGWPYNHFLLWVSWLQAEWDNPSRTDVYIMRATHEARYSNRKGRPFRSKDYTLQFGGRASRGKGLKETPGGPRRATREDVIRFRKRRDLKAVGGVQKKTGLEAVLATRQNAPRLTHPGLRREVLRDPDLPDEEGQG